MVIKKGKMLNSPLIISNSRYAAILWFDFFHSNRLYLYMLLFTGKRFKNPSLVKCEALAYNKAINLSLLFEISLPFCNLTAISLTKDGLPISLRVLRKSSSAVSFASFRTFVLFFGAGLLFDFFLVFIFFVFNSRCLSVRIN